MAAAQDNKRWLQLVDGVQLFSRNGNDFSLICMHYMDSRTTLDEFRLNQAATAGCGDHTDALLIEILQCRHRQ